MDIYNVEYLHGEYRALLIHLLLITRNLFVVFEMENKIPTFKATQMIQSIS